MDTHESIPEARRILVALSDATVAYAFARILEMRGHSAVVAESFIEAIESVPFDVLIAEFGANARGTGLTASELVGALRALGHDPVTIAVASEPDDRDIQAILDLGVDDILNRPVMPERLVEAVEEPRLHSTETACASAWAANASAEMVIEFSAHDEAAESTAREVVAWCLRCDIIPATRARIGSAVAEIVENSVLHGAGQIRLHAHVTPSDLAITITDDGPGFDAVAVLTRGALDCSTGLGRTHSLAESVTIHSMAGDGTAVNLQFRVTTTEFEEEDRIDLTDLDFFVPATANELLATLADDPHAPILLSPALAVVVGRLLMGPRPSSVLEGALRA